ncbi:MAG: hypothetical protein WEB52_06065 [Dehalococcoidia bacterium]
MEHRPIEGRPVRFPPGKVAVTLGKERQSDYRRLYSRASTDLAGLPALRDRDFDGRTVKIAQSELDALNRALAGLQTPPPREGQSVFRAQERNKTRLFKRLQHLS